MTLSTEYSEIATEGMPEFFDFNYGGTHERYTTWPEDLTFQGLVYTAAPLKRSGFTFDTEFSNVKITITAPIESGFEQFVQSAPLRPITVTVYRALRSDLTDYITMFSGHIINVAFKDFVAQATCESNSGILNHETPRIVFQSWCNHELFDGGCALDYTSWQVPAVVTVSGVTISSATFDTYDDGYFVPGRLQFDNDERLITSHSGTDLTVHVPFDASLVDGSSVMAFPGCNGDPDVCINRFDNFTKFLGFPYIPSKNPVVWGV